MNQVKESRATPAHMREGAFLAVILFVLAGLNQGYSQPAGDNFRSAAGEQELLRRYIGNMRIDSQRCRVVLIEYLGEDFYTVSFHLPTAKAGELDGWAGSELQVWLLATNGIALPAMGGGLTWGGKHGTIAVFGFRRTAPMEDLQAVVLGIGETTHVFRIRPRTSNLSSKAQFALDQLQSYSVDEMEAFESGQWKTGSLAQQEVHMGIQNTKEQLRRHGVVATWNPAKKSYEIRY
jgi:hypothetical protein